MKFTTVILLLLTGALHGQGQQALSLTSRIDVPNGNGRIDHFSADVKGKRLVVSALGNNTVEALDIDSGKRLRLPLPISPAAGSVLRSFHESRVRCLRERWRRQAV
jgi:hypothetical protein